MSTIYLKNRSTGKMPVGPTAKMAVLIGGFEYAYSAVA
jgi:hypothetical protein